MFNSNSFAPSANGTPTRPGFTLVDLLVAIGIMAMLIALLVPTQFKAAGANNDAQCRQQLHQFYNATKMFLGDHPKNRVFSGGADYSRIVIRYIKDPSVLRCPSDTSPFTPGIAAAAICIKSNNEVVPLAESLRVHKAQQPDGSYNLSIGDPPPPAPNDPKAEHLTLNVANNADGSVTIRITGNDATDGYDLVDAKSKQVLFPNFQRLGQAHTVPGTLCSYGWNANDEAYGINGKALALDYYKCSADAKTDNWSKDGQWPKDAPRPKFARHLGLINVLWSDGSAAMVTPGLVAIPNNPATDSIAKW